MTQSGEISKGHSVLDLGREGVDISNADAVRYALKTREISREHARAEAPAQDLNDTVEDLGEQALDRALDLLEDPIEYDYTGTTDSYEGTALWDAMQEMVDKHPTQAHELFKYWVSADPDASNAWSSQYDLPEIPSETPAEQVQGLLATQRAQQDHLAKSRAAQGALANFGKSQHAQQVRAEPVRRLMSGEVPLPDTPAAVENAVYTIGRHVDSELRNEQSVLHDPFTEQLGGLDRRLHQGDFLREGESEELSAPGDVDPVDYFVDAMTEQLNPGGRQQRLAQHYGYQRSSADLEGFESKLQEKERTDPEWEAAQNRVAKERHDEFLRRRRRAW